MYGSVVRYFYCGMCLSACLLSAAHTQAGLIISNLQMDESLLTFDLSGTFHEDDIHPDAVDKNLLLIGHPGNADWYHGPGGGKNYIPAAWSSNPDTVGLIAPGLNQNNNLGDYLILVKASGSFAASDAIDGSFSVESSGLFRPGETDLTEWIVSVGYVNPSLPDLATQVGVAVPEPSGAVLVCLMVAAAAGRRRR